MNMREYDAWFQGETLLTPGIDWGAGARPGPTVVFRSGNHVVLKIKGSTQWSGQGQSEYVPTLYMLGRLEPRQRRPDSYLYPGECVLLIPLEQVEPGIKWQATIRELSAKANELALR